jgi:phospholipid-translocating ATPase
VPLVLFDQFKYFFNFFYLLLSISQFIPGLQVGLLFTYVAPLCLVLFLTMVKEAYDDYQRYKKDLEANSYEYRVFRGQTFVTKRSMDLQVGDLVLIRSKERVPADLIFLACNDPEGTIFIKTDQMDGETDWKLRHPCLATQAAFLAGHDISVLARGLVL